jgi:phosphohistidine swiveling domain-containing protein
MKTIDKKKFTSFDLRAVRDISLLSCSIFGESYWITEKMFNIKYPGTLWIYNNRQIEFRRVSKANNRLSKILGQALIRKKGFVEKISKELIKISKWFYYFVKRKNLNDLIKQKIIFFDNYRYFFALRKIIYWGGEYVAKTKQTKRIKNMIKLMRKVYKYEEMVIPEVEKFFKKHNVSHLLYDEINENVRKTRKSKTRSIIFLGRKRHILDEKQGKQIINYFKQQLKDVRKFKGVTASKGYFKGKVRIVQNFRDFAKCNKGDVLVTHMTRPNYNSYIRKVGAIVTNEGNILSHAAILAREFKIPCIVGTKFATDVLKDRDIVEVDADNGIVKVIKRK